MEFLRSRIKTDHTSDLSPQKKMLNASDRKLSRLQQTKRSLQRIRMMTSRSTPKLKPQDKVIREENIRLISKIMEISHRKLKIKGSEVFFPSKKRENPERQREIAQENQRLGRSIVRIKSGKSVERVKTDIAKSLSKLSKSKKKQQLLTQPSQKASQPQQSPNSNLLYLSKQQSLPKRLPRVQHLHHHQLLRLKQLFT